MKEDGIYKAGREIGVSESGLQDTRLNLGLFPLFLALLLLCTHSWGACSSYQYTRPSTSFANCINPWNNVVCSGGPIYCGHSSQGCSSQTSSSGDCAYRSGGSPTYYGSMYGQVKNWLNCVQCNTQSEVDSVLCVNGGQSWHNGQCQAPCDSTKWTCNTTIENTQTTIAGENVTCFGGNCYGGVYCEYISRSTTQCINECGSVTTDIAEVPIRYEGACNPDNLTDEDECTNVRCTSFSEHYTLFKLCKSREIVNGEQKFLPHFVGGGKGNCKNAGWLEADSSSNVLNSSNSQGEDIPETCFTMGMGCPESDTTSYVGDSRNSDNCYCDPFDGMSYISRIVCPDGSVSTFYGSCDDFRSSTSTLSSSSVPPESSSSSENGTSSGGPFVGDWTTYSQGEDIKGILGVIASKLDKQQNINNVNSVNIALDDYSGVYSDSATFSRSDSIFDPDYTIDTSGIVEAIFGRIDPVNRILDTLQVGSSTCPCFTFFQGSSFAISGGHISLPEIKIDMLSMWGIDFCLLVRSIVFAFASVVSFFIGFAIFKNISQ